MSLFAGLTIAHGKMQLKETFKGSGKREAYHSHVKEEVTIESWEGHLNGQSIGIVPIRDDGESCVFGAIDIDAYNNFSFEHLLSKIDKLELPLVVCKSKSGGAHCYLFVSEPVKAEQIHSLLREWSAAIGYASNTRGEPTEIFPKQVRLLIDQGDVGSFINMPYADGNKSTRVCVVKSPEGIRSLNMSEFLDYAESKKIKPEDLKKIELPKSEEFSDGPPCLQYIAKMGASEGGRNNALYNMAAYYKKAFPDSWEDKLEEANRKFINPSLGSREITNIIKSFTKKDYAYTCKLSPIVDHCHRSVCLQKKFGIGSDLGETPTLDSILKIDTDPPTYILNLLDRNGRPVPVQATADDLLSVRKIKKKCLENMNYLPYIPGQSEWEKLLQQVMERVVIISVPEDSSPSGQLLIFLEKFLSHKTRGKHKEELLKGKPVLIEDKMYFRMHDFSEFLKRNGFKNFEVNQITAIFRKHFEAGFLGHKTFNVRGKCVQTWFTDRMDNDIELKVPEEISDDHVY